VSSLNSINSALGKLETAKNMLELGLTIEIISKSTGLTVTVEFIGSLFTKDKILMG
jgi:hypothetical protein